MPKKSSKSLPGQLKFLWLSLAVLILDIITKSFAEHYLFRIISIPVCPILNVTLVHNKGAAFGFLAGEGGWQLKVFVIITIAILAGLIFWLSRLGKTDRWLSVAIALIIAGALGNGIDRVALGYVIDFIDLHIHQYHWPAFNVADIAITTGAIMLVIKFWRAKKS